MVPPRLTYCANVHAASDLDTAVAMLHAHTAKVAAAARAQGRAFGAGAWWPMALVRELAADAAARDRLVATLRDLDLPLWTLNVFPFGGFHDEVVKAAVYAPDWSHEDRLEYTRLCAVVAASTMPRGAVLPMSTLPLGHRPPGTPPADLRLMARNLVRCASAFAGLEERTGVRCVLALEPEPDCLLETCAGAAAFLDQWVFDEGAWPLLPAPVLRRHIGVCVDLCHLAVVGEDPLQALAALRERGVAVPKIQVSACLEARGAAGLDRLLSFAEPRYLHQTVADSGVRVLDLEEAAARRAEFATAARVRSHYHVPVYWDDPGPLGSTRSEVERVLAALAGAKDEPPLLEVETYTWHVLGRRFGDEPLASRIARELDWVAARVRVRAANQ